METIRIIIYTDTLLIDETPMNPWGITELKKFVLLKLEGIAKVEIKVTNRHWDAENKKEINGINRITRSLLGDCDEIWLLGYRQVNIPNANPPEPHNELEKYEIDLLEEWMKSGGILITGDHSEPDRRNPNGSCKDDHATFLTLGRALGKCIRRAGQLRVWEGPPTNCITPYWDQTDTYNTQEGTDLCKLDFPGLEMDAFPQTLTLVNPCYPHTLFRKPTNGGKSFTAITKFPDHGHEGRLLAPGILDGEWPAGSPLPQVIAMSSDKRFPEERRMYSAVVAYDGHIADVGRIVSDSSFHHYLNFNISSLPNRESSGMPQCGTPLDDIAQYYGNLALWLAPQELREKIKLGLIFDLAKHPDVLQLRGNEAYILGRAALIILKRQIGLTKLGMVLQSSGFESKPTIFDLILSYLFLHDSSLPEDSFLRAENLLGGVIYEYHQLFNELGLSDPTGMSTDPAGADVIIRKVLQASLGSNLEFSEFLRLTKS